MPRWAWVALGLVALTVAAVLLVPRHAQSPEELIRERVVQMARAAEERRLSFIMDQVSLRFRSKEGWGRDELKGFLAAQLLQGTWLRVFPTDLEVRSAGPAQVEFTGTFIFGRSQARTLKDLVRESRFEAERVSATFEREPDGEWRVVSAAHEPVSQEQLLREAR